MRQYIPVITLAAALALLLGVLLPWDNVVHAADPKWEANTNNREIPENTPPGVNIGDPISATDADEDTLEFGNTLTYSLEGNNAALFDIDSSTGQLITKAPLDHEDKASYSVTVRVDDGESGPDATRDVTITVNDVDEPPLAPIPPTVVSGEDDTDDNVEESTRSLNVVWHPPVNTGRSNINDYNVEYKKSTETGFGTTGVSNSGTTTNAEITGLDPDTSYDVRVQGTNDEGDGAWSFVGTGSTNKEGNSPPQLTDGTSTTRNVDENTPAGENIGSPVSATDGDTTTLTYSLGGPDAGLFNFHNRTGQIRTKAALNHEDLRCGYDDTAQTTACTYRVTVIVVDGAGGSDASGVNISVVNRVEPPSAPAQPTVRATEKSSASLDVSWNAPANSGPPITGYEVEYRKDSETFSADGVAITGTTATISGVDNNDDPRLASNTTYEVRVRAVNRERASAWSATGTGRTNRANHQPIFDDRPHTGDGSEHNQDYTIARTIDENPRSSQSLGRVFADDEDNDRLTYKLVEAENTDQAREELSKFTINETTGEIRTKAGVTYNYEDIADSETCGDTTVQGAADSDRCYTVKVEVRDGLDDDRVKEEDEGPDDSITLKIGVRDRDEPPAVPTVTVTSPVVNTTLEVVWEADNTGPPITSFDVQYRKGSGAFSDDNCGSAGVDNCSRIDDAIPSTKITGLDDDTSYSVQIRARNDEGVSTWSRSITLKTNKGTNTVPTFTDTNVPIELEVAENTPSNRDVDTAVSASDEGSTSLTYSLEGPDANLFTIVSSTGQIRTRTSLNHEDPACGYVSTATPTSCTYSVRVKVDDRAGGSNYGAVTITVSDVDEAPIAPSAPRVTATKDTGWSLDVTWSEPRNTGKPPINDYDIQYRKVGDQSAEYENWPHGTDLEGNTDTSAKITRRTEADDAAEPLEPRTQYEVRVRAKNGEGDTTENWSSVGRGTTGPSNSRPEFDRSDSLIELRVDENTRVGQNLGSVISASDADSNSLTYTLEGPGKDSFSIVSSSGQIRTRSPLDHETRESYSLTVKVDDRQGKDNSIAAKSVTVMVDDVREPPPAPAAPRVAGIPGSTSSVRVTWDEPANTGPQITGYDVHYREVGEGWGRWSHTSADRSTILTELKAGTRYEAQVRARSAEGTGEWSRPGSGMPNPDVANRNPAFTGGARTLNVPENSLSNTDIGTPIAATDRDGDTLTYTMEGTDADSFDILSTSDGGQIRTSAELNFEEKSSYSVTVRVTDGRGGTDAANVTIRVTDVDGEAPATPLGPTVTPVSSTSLQVSWEEPDNAGPPITDYDYQYREVSGSWTEVINTTITGTTVTIERLSASTSYDVAVRAKNAEGTSDWSSEGSGQTNDAGANNPPVFTEGTSATRSVSASAPAGTFIGAPVTATDADSGDTLDYSLEGRDAALFDVNDTSGQLLTKSGITLIVDETYTVTVAADDGSDIARISVSINATAAPPNNPPVFTEGASAARSVSASAPAGTSIGAPLTATDADAGATLAYSLEGADAASFGINPANGQLLTVAGVTLDRSTYIVDVVASDGSATSRITVTITVTPNRAPVFSEGGTATRSVREDAASSTAIGSPVTATDADPGTTLAYRLEGTDAGSFTVNTANGQLLTSAALDADTKATYTVDVVASDGSLEARITVTITVTALPTSFGCATRGAVSDASNTGLVSDCEALLDARDVLVGLGGPLNWSASTPIAQWDGVTVDGTSMRVTTLDLRRSRLKGVISSDLSRVTALRKLYLQDNHLTGPIPSELGSMTALTHLYAGNNDLSGAIPSQMGSMTELTELRLRSNDLSGPLPAALGSLTNLTYLLLSDNDLSGSIPSQIGDMSSLYWLDVGQNNISGTLPAELGNLSQLGRLYVYENDLTGSIPITLGNLTGLTHIVAQENDLSGSIPVQLGNMSALVWMGLYDNDLSGAIPTQLSRLSNLQRLYLSNNDLTGTIPRELGQLSALTDLWLDDNGLSGTIPSELDQLTNLVRWRMRGNDFTGCVPAGLAAVRSTDFDQLGLPACSGS